MKRIGEVVADLLSGGLDDLDEGGALDFLAVGLGVAVAVGVEEAELHRVHAEVAGDHVHLRFQREVADGDAESAHRRGRGAVGVDAPGVDVDVGDRVGPRHVGGGLGGAVGGVAAIGAGVDVEGDLAGDDAAVVHHPVLDVEPFGGAGRAHLHLLGAGVDVLDWAVGEHGAEGGDGLDDDVDLAAEAAADGAADQPQLVERHVEDQRHVVEGEVEGLGVGVDGDAAVALGLRRAAGGLDRGVLDGRGFVAVLEDVVGLGEAGFDVAEANATALVAFVDVVVRPVLLERRRLDRLLDVEDRRQILVVDADAAGTLLGGGAGFGEDGADLLAHEQHVALGQHRLVVRPDADQPQDGVPVLRHVLVGEHPDDARHGQRRRDVEGELRVVPRRADHHEVQGVGEVHVLVELGAAGDVPARIRPRHGGADDREVGRTFLREEVRVDAFHQATFAFAGRSAARTRSAASSTASMIAA